MELFDLGFVRVRLIDIIDISVVSFLLYQVYQRLRGSVAIRVAGVIISIFLFWRLIDLMDFRLLESILNPFLSLGAIAVVIIFAPEIRFFLSDLSKQTLLDRILRPTATGSVTDSELVCREVVEALKSLRATGNGALIVLEGVNPLKQVRASGDLIDANLSARLIFTIFQKESPLHDGAMLIKGNKITAVRSILPLSKNSNLSAELGLRHRAGLGLSEISDALIVIASEERREVSLALEGKLTRNVGYQDIVDAISRHYSNSII